MQHSPGADAASPSFACAPRSRAPLASVLLVGLALLVSCGGTQPPPGATKTGFGVTETAVVPGKLTERKQTQPLIQYGARCYDLAAKMERRRAAGKLRPIELRVRQSTTPGLVRGTFVHERQLADALLGGTLRSAVVVGLGGVGKSTFAKALEAHVCQQLPTVRVDLNLGVARKMPPGSHKLPGAEPNAVLAAAAQALGVSPSARQGALSAAARALGGGDWLLILDSLDEVSDARHRDVLRSVRDALPVAKGARVLVFTRPPVATPLADLASIKNVVELEPQSCSDVQRTLRDWGKKRPEVRELPAMFKRLGLDRRVQLGGRCAHPHLMTWRDLTLVTRLGFWRRGRHQQPWDKHFDGSRASLYRLFALDTLGNGFDDTGRTPQALLKVLDAVAAQGSRHAMDRAIDTSAADCEKAADSCALSEPKRFCQGLLRTRLFGDRRDDGRVGFTNQSVADWLIARRLDAGLNAVPAAQRCEQVARHDQRFQSSEIAAFFVGMTHGRACLYTVARALCRTRALPLDLVRTLERGLPWGAARTTALKRAAERMRGAKHPEDACVRKLLAQVARP